MKIDYPEGATPIDPEEAKGLKLPHITTRDQLNKWEQANILQAEAKFFPRAQKKILTEEFILRLHKGMFGTVWKWAGKYRTSEKNIGVASWDVAVKVKGLCEDTQAWIKARDPADDLAARFHHRLVSLHPFSNGNGRHSRMMADLLLVHVLGRPRFTWGRVDLANAGEARAEYLAALREADNRNYGPLFSFVRC